VLDREAAHMGEAPAHGDRDHGRCEAWDRLASAAISDLIADRDPLVEQRLGVRYSACGGHANIAGGTLSAWRGSTTRL
jgi:hypothetical protein